jgi:outer membrane protein insertion porin family
MKQLSVIKKENEDLEKPVNKLNNTLMFFKKIRLLIAILFLGSANNALAQDGGIPSGSYILGGIDVTGKVTYNEQTIITFTELEKGQRINVPGEEISNAIKKLWKLGLFSDIEFYSTRTEGDTIYLELYINELPKLNEARIQGVRKGKREDLIKDTQLTKGKYVNENLITNTKKLY